MAKVTDQPELVAAPAATDMFLVSEISSGLSKKINFSRMISGYRNFTTGAWSLSAPTAGVTMTITGLSGQFALVVQNVTGAAQAMVLAPAGQTALLAVAGNNLSGTPFQVRQDGSGNAELLQSANARLDLYTNGIIRARLAATGGLELFAPTSGKAFAVNGEVTVASGTATPAGGTAGKGLTFGTTANLGVFFGSGAPTLSAAQGSLYMRTDGSSTSTRLYVNTNGTTGWTNVTTAT